MKTMARIITNLVREFGILNKNNLFINKAINADSISLIRNFKLINSA